MRAAFRFARLATLTLAAMVLAPVAAHAQGRVVTGTYTVSIESPQGPVKAVLVLKKVNGAFAGSLAADGFPELPVATAVPTDTSIVITADTPDGGVTVTVKFSATEKVTGSVLYQGMDMPMTGTFAPGDAKPAGGTPDAAAFAVRAVSAATPAAAGVSHSLAGSMGPGGAPSSR
jgi:hypothetical protein